MVDEKFLYMGIGFVGMLYLMTKFTSLRPKSASLYHPYDNSGKFIGEVPS